METIHSSRKRVVGGFYVYDSHVEQQALGTLCQGKSDAQGRLDCQVSLSHMINYECPDTDATYVHRIGRTGFFYDINCILNNFFRLGIDMRSRFI